jgi:hypothetical protein
MGEDLFVIPTINDIDSSHTGQGRHSLLAYTGPGLDLNDDYLTGNGLGGMELNLEMYVAPFTPQSTFKTP